MPNPIFFSLKNLRTTTEKIVFRTISPKSSALLLMYKKARYAELDSSFLKALKQVQDDVWLLVRGELRTNTTSFISINLIVHISTFIFLISCFLKKKKQKFKVKCQIQSFSRSKIYALPPKKLYFAPFHQNLPHYY